MRPRRRWPGWSLGARAASVRAALGLVHAEVGRLDEARDIFEAIGQADFAQLPVEASTVVAYCFCARLAAALDDPGRAAQLHRLLAPYPDQIAVWAVGLGIGCVSYYLGLLALCMGALDEALEHFAAAAAIEQRVGAPTWLARTRVGWARALLTRRAPGDAEQAEHLLEQAWTTPAGWGWRASNGGRQRCSGPPPGPLPS